MIKNIKNLPGVNIQIINIHNYHYEIIETIMTVFLSKILKIHHYRKKRIFLDIKKNDSFIKYIYNKFYKNPYYKLYINSNISIRKPRIHVTIYISLYKKKMHLISNKKNVFYRLTIKNLDGNLGY